MELNGAIRKLSVVTSEEGAHLGHVRHVFLDSSTSTLKGFTFRTYLSGKERYAPMSEVTRIGRDVVFLRSEASSREIDREHPPEGRNLADLEGCWVTTDTGDHVGHLADLEVSEDGWRITSIHLTDGARFQVAEGLRIGQDAILVPAAAVANLERPKAPPRGILNQLLAGEGLSRLRDTMQKAFDRIQKTATSSEAEPEAKAEEEREARRA